MDAVEVGNFLLKVNDSDFRIYYDVIGAAPLSVDPSGQNGYRYTCVALSKNGIDGWVKPKYVDANCVSSNE